MFDKKNGEELTNLYLKSDVILFTSVFEKTIKVSINEFDFNSLFCVSLLGNFWKRGLKYTEISIQVYNLNILQDKDMTLLLEKNIRRGISSVMADRNVVSDYNKEIKYVNSKNLLIIQCLNQRLMMKLNLTKKLY